MSLQVWLPLNGSLNNNGIFNSTISNNGATVNSAGKIGSCYNFDGSNDYVSLNYPCYSASMSFALWVYFTATPGGAHLFDARSSDSVGYQPMYITSSSIQIGCTATGYENFTYNFSYGVWYHIAVTHDANRGYCYINGSLIGSSTTAKGYNFSTNISARIGCRHTSVNWFYGRVNDIRIYDNCLSASEVRDLAKGLVAHYPLSDPYIEPTTNICNILSNECYNGSTGKYGYGTSTDMYKTSGVFQGRDCTKIYMGTSGLAAWPFVFFDSITPSTTNAYKTLSFDYFPSVLNKVVFYSYNVGGNMTWRVNYTTLGSGGTIPVAVGKWNHIELTIQATGSSGYGFGYMRISDGGHTSNTSNYWLFSNIQVESQNHATGYVTSSRNTSVLYDTSGYGNNVIQGNYSGPYLIYGGPRYNSCYSFNGSQWLNAGQGGKVTDAITVSWWGYMDNWSNYGRAISCTEGGGWNFEPISSKMTFNIYVSSVGYLTVYDTVALSSLSAGWHLFVGTYDRANLKLYRDGVLVGTTASSSSNLIGYYSANSIFIGAEASGSPITPTSPYFTGKMSDVRIYATALSASAIADLYNAPIKITKSGSLTTNGEILE